MSKFDELKKLADAATIGNWSACGPSFGATWPKYCDEVVSDADESGEEVTICTGPHWDKEYWPDRSINMQFIAAANPVAMRELLAIQAQQVKILKSITSAIRDGFKIEYGSIIYHEAIDALAASGAQL